MRVNNSAVDKGILKGVVMAFLALIAILCMVGCSNWTDHSVGKTKIAAFYYHEKNRYSAAINIDGAIKKVSVPAAVITLDAEDYPWYECDYKKDYFYGKTTGACYVHLRSISEINTAGWNHGKLGRGSTGRMN